MKTCHGTAGLPTGPFGPADRLLRSEEFTRVLRRGQRVTSPEIVVLTAPAAQKSAARRLGLVVSRRVGGAVVRNRLKRRVREWFRLARGRVKPGTDLVVIARRPAVALSGRELAEALDRGLAEDLR